MKRCTDGLYVPRSTLQCALLKKCVPCCYKIIAYGSADMEPNQRPELCPRSAFESRQAPELLSNNMNSLIIHDSSLSFTWSIRSHVASSEVVLKEAKATLLKSNPELTKKLKKLGNKVHFECTMEDIGDYGAFDCVMWNQPDNAQVQTFFDNAVLAPNGQILITCPLSATKSIIDCVAQTRYKHVGTLVFDRCSYPGYKVSHECETLVFACDGTENVFSTCKAIEDGYKNWTAEEWNSASLITPMTPVLLSHIQAILRDKSNFPKKEKTQKKVGQEEKQQKKKQFGEDYEEDEVDYVQMYGLKPKGKAHKIKRKQEYEANQEGKLRPTKRKLPVKVENGKKKKACSKWNMQLWANDLSDSMLLNDVELFDMLPDATDDAFAIENERNNLLKKKERERKVLYRRRLKEEFHYLTKLSRELETKRDRLQRQQQQRLMEVQVPGHQEAMAQWATIAKELRQRNIAALHLNQSLRESLRHQLNLTMSYQRSLFHLNLALTTEAQKSSIYRLLQEHLEEGMDVNLRSKWTNAKDTENQCNIILNEDQTDIEQVEVIRCIRRRRSDPNDVVNSIWQCLIGESTHNVPATRIAQRLDTIDNQTCYTRVYFCDDFAPFALNLVQHRYAFPDKQVIVYRTMDIPEKDDMLQKDILKWYVVCWVEITKDDCDTMIKEYIRYTQVGSGGLLPLLISCRADETNVASQLRAWMHHVVSSLYSCCT
ncbi:hypothetical protein THRCLA_08437, partial [Thraustotheca clavata]